MIILVVYLSISFILFKYYVCTSHRYIVHDTGGRVNKSILTATVKSIFVFVAAISFFLWLPERGHSFFLFHSFFLLSLFLFPLALHRCISRLPGRKWRRWRPPSPLAQLCRSNISLWTMGQLQPQRGFRLRPGRKHPQQGEETPKGDAYFLNARNLDPLLTTNQDPRLTPATWVPGWKRRLEEAIGMRRWTIRWMRKQAA